MSEYTMNKQSEKKAGVVRELRGEITINHENYDFGVIRHLTTEMGFDVEISKVHMGPFDGKTHIKVFENVKVNF